jgi:hypothetical protein
MKPITRKILELQAQCLRDGYWATVLFLPHEDFYALQNELPFCIDKVFGMEVRLRPGQPAEATCYP